MGNIIKRSALVLLLLVLVPAHGISANTEEAPAVEESAEQPVSEESTEQQGYEESAEESVEGNNDTTEESSNEYVPPQNEQPQYEETTEAPYESYEEPAEEFYYEEETAEETVEEWTEEVTEEATETPTEEVTAEPETVEEPADVTINQAAVEEFSIAGKVTADDAGLEDVTVVLLGEKEDEVTTDENGEFSFTEVPSGEYGLQVEAPEGYTAEKETLSLTVDDRGKRGVTFVMEEAPTEESIETDDQVMSDQDTEPTNNMTVILVGVVLLAIIAILFIVKALRR